MIRMAFIANPISGTKDKERLLGEVERRFTPERGYDIIIHRTTGRGDATLAARKFASERYHVVVAVGGDGTVNEVAKGLMHSNTTLGVIPVGSGNGLARHFGIPLCCSKAMELLERGRRVKVDAGKVNGEYFFCTAGIGFEAKVGDAFNNAGSRGLFTYFKVCAKVYFGYVREFYRIAIGSRRIGKRAFLITFANCNQWGNDIKVAKGADASDGKLEIILWERAPMGYMWLWPWLLLRGRIRYSRFADSFRAESLDVERESSGLVQIDGDAVMMSQLLHIETIHNAIEIIAP